MLGQGIGLLSETLLRAADHAGLKVKGVDTHGLAQRGGIVVSQLRIGENANSPLIARGRAHMVISLERHEALRGMNRALGDGGTLVYYDAVWQPLGVRLDQDREVDAALILSQAEKRHIRVVRVFSQALDDPRMQNMVVLGHLAGHDLVPGVGTGHYTRAMADLMTGSMLEKNLALFEVHCAEGMAQRAEGMAHGA